MTERKPYRSAPAWFVCALLLAGVGMAGCGGSSNPGGTTAGAGGGPRGDAAGVALVKRVIQSYQRVPAVLATTSVGGSTARFTIILQHGIVVAEEFAGGAGANATKLVAPPHSPTYALEPGTHCWRKLAASNPQALSDVGARFPHLTPRVRLFAPQRNSTGWVLRATSGSAHATYSIDAATLQISSVAVSGRRGSTTESLQSLSSQPALASPSPRC